MNSLLFLDFDGVVHRGTSGSFERLPLLELWLLDHPNVDVVVSSTWRLEHSLEWLRDCFAFEELHSRVIGVTPELLTEVPYLRQAEIELWLSQNQRTAARYAALDDDASLYRPGCPWLVSTDYRTALQPAHLDELGLRLS